MIADLHIHSRFSRGCSKDITLAKLEQWAKKKGVDLLGTGDFTHPDWVQELKRNLVEEQGIYYTQKGFPFVCQTEISLIYTQNKKSRKVHHVVLAPSLDVVGQITDFLKKHGRVDYDGRPIFGMSSPDFVYELKQINKDIEVFPAHIWTPYFGALGSKSGFDSLQECFGDQMKHIHAYETGLSSNPAMNWRLSSLDGLTQISNSDTHSYWPWRLGREANMLELSALTYKNILNAIRTKEGFKGTIEVDPQYGKYHADGHAKCNLVSMPHQTKQLRGICPACKKPLTIGVQSRVEELADREEGYRPEAPTPYKSLLPLSEVLGNVLGTGIQTKQVWNMYEQLTKQRSEYDVLLKMNYEEIAAVHPRIADALLRNRYGQIRISPGFDGNYGIPDLHAKAYQERLMMTPQMKHIQTSLDTFG